MEKVRVKIIKAFATFDKGLVRGFSAPTANGLIRGGYAELENAQKEYSEMSLKELRVLFPEIKATSVDKFIDQIDA